MEKNVFQTRIYAIAMKEGRTVVMEVTKVTNIALKEVQFLVHLDSYLIYMFTKNTQP